MTARLVALLLLAAAARAGEDTPPPAYLALGDGDARLLVGEVTRADLGAELPGWDASYADYEPDPDLVAELAEAPPAEILCVMGTWCHDSEREVPRFWKVLDAAANPGLVLTMVAVGRTDDEAAAAALGATGRSPTLRADLGIELVPTFVFRRDGEELGRIVETPAASLEEDAAALLAAAPAAPAWR